MAVYDLTAAGTSTSTGTANLTRIWNITASGASTSSGTAVLYIIQDIRVTQTGVQIDISRTTPVRTTQTGVQVDVERVVPERVTQTGVQIDVERVVPERVTSTSVQIDVGGTVPARVTQALLQLDARLRRPRVTVDCWEFHVEDRAGTYLTYLDNAFQKGYFATLSDTGSGRFALLSDDSKVNSTNIAVGNIVKVRYKNVDVGAWVMEEIAEILVGPGEDATKVTTVSGRGVLGLLDKALVYPTDIGDATTVEREFSAVTKADIFITLHDEFVARGGGDLTESFTDTNDTDSVAWTDSVTINFKAGQSLLQVIKRLAALGEFDIKCDPDRTLNAYVSAGSDLSSTIIFRQGLNIYSCSRNQSGRDIANVVLGEGQGVLAEDTDATSISSFGRREAYLPVRNTDQSAQVSAANDLLLTQFKNPSTKASLQLTVSTDKAPFIDYDIGDTVQVEIPDKVSTSYRVLSIAMEEGQGPCDLQIALELNSTEAEYIARMQRAFDASLLGVQPGQGATTSLASDTTAPVASSDGTSMDNDAVKKRHIDWGTGATQVNSADLPWITASKATDYTATSSDTVILCDATSGTVTITLPAAAAANNAWYAVKKIDSSGNPVVVDGDGAETIDGAATKTLSSQWDSTLIVCDGSEWFVV